MALNRHGVATDEDDIDPEWLIEWSMENNHGGVNSQYIFNFRQDADDERCACGDVAKWPSVPGYSRYIGSTTKVDLHDEAGVLVESVHVELL